MKSIRYQKNLDNEKRKLDEIHLQNSRSNSQERRMSRRRRPEKLEYAAIGVGDKQESVEETVNLAD